MVGLLNGSLYEALQNPTVEQGQAPIMALGFDIICGYLPANITDAPGPTGNPAELEELSAMTIRFSNLASDGGILFGCVYSSHLHDFSFPHRLP
jgi:hypothetical protein